VALVEDPSHNRLVALVEDPSHNRLVALVAENKNDQMKKETNQVAVNQRMKV
jgi:hypothetical protein